MPSEERQIQFFGLIRPTLEPGRIVKWWRISADIIRPQISRYRNDRYPEFETFYGYLQCMLEDRVARTYNLDYNNSIVAEEYNTSGFLHQALSCHLEAILTSFEEQNTALGLLNIARTNPIKSWSHLFYFPTEIKIRLLTENVVMKFLLEWDYVENCSADVSIQPPPELPPPPPPPPPEIPATDTNTPTPNSPAYEPPDDNGETFNPGAPEPPEFEECEAVIVTVELVSPDTGSETLTYGMRAPIGDVFVTCTSDGSTYSSGLVIQARGTFPGECLPEQTDIVVAGRSGGGDSSQCFISVELISIEPA